MSTVTMNKFDGESLGSRQKAVRKYQKPNLEIGNPSKPMEANESIGE